MLGVSVPFLISSMKMMKIRQRNSRFLVLFPWWKAAIVLVYHMEVKSLVYSYLSI